jgi:hypothetical protein
MYRTKINWTSDITGIIVLYIQWTVTALEGGANYEGDYMGDPILEEDQHLPEMPTPVQRQKMLLLFTVLAEAAHLVYIWTDYRALSWRRRMGDRVPAYKYRLVPPVKKSAQDEEDKILLISQYEMYDLLCS